MEREEQETTEYRGEEIPTSVRSRRDGQGRSMTFDGGRRLGVSRCFAPVPEEEENPAEQESSRRAVDRICREFLGKTVVWKENFP